MMGESWQMMKKRLGNTTNIPSKFFSEQVGTSNIQDAKTSTRATHLLYHQGYYINSLEMTYKISDVKLETIITTMLDLGRCCTLKELAKVTGKLMSIRKATGPIVRISLHHTFKLISDQVKKYGEVAWKIAVELPDAVLDSNIPNLESSTPCSSL